MTLVVAVAPGARHTAVVLRSDDTLRGHQVVEHREAPLDWYLGEVVDAVTKLKERALQIILQDTPAYIGNPAILAVQDPTAAAPAITSAAARRDAFTIAEVVGAVAGQWITRRVTEPIDPVKLTFYPDRLQGRTIRARQLRLAWDIAGHAMEEVTT